MACGSRGSMILQAWASFVATQSSSASKVCSRKTRAASKAWKNLSPSSKRPWPPVRELFLAPVNLCTQSISIQGWLIYPGARLNIRNRRSRAEEAEGADGAAMTAACGSLLQHMMRELTWEFGGQAIVVRREDGDAGNDAGLRGIGGSLTPRQLASGTASGSWVSCCPARSRNMMSVLLMTCCRS